MAQSEILSVDDFSVGFSDREVTAWGGLALFKKMLDSMGFSEAVTTWGLPEPGSNRGYEPRQLVEHFSCRYGVVPAGFHTLKWYVWTTRWCVCLVGRKRLGIRLWYVFSIGLT